MQFSNKLVVLMLITLILIPCSIFSQDSMTLTLDKSISLSLKNNPEIKMAEKELSKAKAGVWEAYSNILPQLDASASFQHSWEIQTSTLPNFIKPMIAPLAPYIPEVADAPDYIQISFGLENTFRYGAVVSQPLFLGGAGIAGIQAARSMKNATAENLEEKKQSLIYNTTNAFYLCLLTKELIDVQQEAYEQAKANFDIVAKKYEVGNASGFDKMRAEVEVANMKPELITAQNNYQMAITQLKTILGLNRDTIIGIEGKFQFTEDAFGSMSLEEIQEMALTNRPVVLALDAQKNMTRKGVALARSNFLPKLFFQTELSYMAMKNNYDLAQDDFSKGFTSAFSLQVPLFTGFRHTKQYQKARLDYKIMLDTEKQVFDGVAAEAEVSYNKFKEAKQKYLSANQTVDLAKEALRLANLMYEEGANTQLDVLNSQLALTRARVSHVNSLYEYEVSRYQLRKVTGKLKGILE